MKTPTLIRSIEQDLADGHTAVIQIVSTGEALMARRLAEIPTEEWNDVRVDITPREYILDYLARSFPVQLYEPFSDSEGNLSSRPVYRDGQPVESREANQLIEGDVARGRHLLNGSSHRDVLRDGRPRASLSTSNPSRNPIRSLPLLPATTTTDADTKRNPLPRVTQVVSIGHGLRDRSTISIAHCDRDEAARGL